MILCPPSPAKYGGCIVTQFGSKINISTNLNARSRFTLELLLATWAILLITVVTTIVDVVTVLLYWHAAFVRTGEEGVRTNTVLCKWNLGSLDLDGKTYLLMLQGPSPGPLSRCNDKTARKLPIDGIYFSFKNPSLWRLYYHSNITITSKSISKDFLRFGTFFH